MGRSPTFLSAVSNQFAETFLPPERIDAFISKECERLSAAIKKQKMVACDSVDQQNIRRIFHLAHQLGLLTDAPVFKPQGQVERGSTSGTSDWQAVTVDGSLIHKGILIAGSASNLLDAVRQERVDGFVEKNMELILRHVEVKRAKSLQKYEKEMDKAQIWSEKCCFAVLFARYARVKNDWRYLNAALKLNEWLWKEYRRPFSNKALLPFLTALVEQEYVLREMEQC